MIGTLEVRMMQEASHTVVVAKPINSHGSLEVTWVIAPCGGGDGHRHPGN
ncbi:MAG: hypothetical protein ACKN81_01705 [Pirellulaceae bacterium]